MLCNSLDILCGRLSLFVLDSIRLFRQWTTATLAYIWFVTCNCPMSWHEIFAIVLLYAWLNKVRNYDWSNKSTSAREREKKKPPQQQIIDKMRFFEWRTWKMLIANQRTKDTLETHQVTISIWKRTTEWIVLQNENKTDEKEEERRNLK